MSIKRFIFMCSGIATLLLCLSSCHISSKYVMCGDGGRTSYNIAAQNTTNQELLINIIRLRYSDTPYFLSLNGITTQFNFTSKFTPSIKIPYIDKGNPINLGGDLAWTNQPTIQYAPLTGNGFAIQLLSPLDIRVLQQFVLSGWNVDHIFRLLINNMANISNICFTSDPISLSSSSYVQFIEITNLMRYFQKKGDLQIGISHYHQDEKTIQYEKTMQSSKESPNTIQISFSAEGEKADRLAQLLKNMQSIEGRYVLSMSQAFNKKAEMGIMTRSLLDVMYYLSLGVHIPPQDVANKVVSVIKKPDGTCFNWDAIIGDLIKIHWSYNYPQHAYLAVPYRGYWFYIDDSDVNSKHTFVLLQYLFNLQSKQSEKERALLTIPLGKVEG